MAYESLGKTVDLPAASGSLVQFTFMKVNASAQFDVVAATGADAQGVLQNKPLATGQAAEAMISEGFTKIVAGNIFSVGQDLASDSQGRAIFAATGDVILGKALELPVNVGDVVTMLFQKGGRKT